jgi:UDP-glucose 4-epimerase
VEHVLITGGAGFIGSHLAERLIRQGCRVTVMDDLSTGSLENLEHLRRTDRGRKLRICIESIRNEMVLDRLISECDMVYHLAAAVGVRLIVERPVHVLETNILGTGVVLNSACRYRKKVLIASTSEIYGKSEQVPFKEEDDRVLGSTTRSRWCYSDSKAVDEFLALAYFKEKGL